MKGTEAQAQMSINTQTMCTGRFVTIAKNCCVILINTGKEMYKVLIYVICRC